MSKKVLLGAIAGTLAIGAAIPLVVGFEQNENEFVASFGSRGTGSGQFQYIEDFAIDGDGNLLATDAVNANVQIFSPEGQFIRAFGDKTDGPNGFQKPEGIAVDSAGAIYVADYLAGFIKKFDSSLEHRLTFSGLGSEPGLTIESEFMSIGPNQLLYVADAGNNCVDVFDLDGQFSREAVQAAPSAPRDS